MSENAFLIALQKRLRCPVNAMNLLVDYSKVVMLFLENVLCELVVAHKVYVFSKNDLYHIH